MNAYYHMDIVVIGTLFIYHSFILWTFQFVSVFDLFFVICLSFHEFISLSICYSLHWNIVKISSLLSMNLEHYPFELLFVPILFVMRWEDILLSPCFRFIFIVIICRLLFQLPNNSYFTYNIQKSIMCFCYIQFSSFYYYLLYYQRFGFCNASPFSVRFNQMNLNKIVNLMQTNSVGIQFANEKNQMQCFDKIISMSTFMIECNEILKC